MTGRSDLLGRIPTGPEDPWWIEQVKASPDAAVLFLGAGTGRTALPLLAACDELVAVESDTELRRAFEARLAELGPVAERAATLARDPADLTLDRRFGLVILPAVLVNAVHDPQRRLAIARTAAGHCRPDGTVVIETVDPYWLVGARLDAGARIGGEEGAGVEVAVRELAFDPWEQRRSAHITYRFPDGATVEDRFDATALFPRELRALVFQAGLELVEAPVAASGTVATWRLVCRPARSPVG